MSNCEDCTKKECSGCKYEKDRFKIKYMCDVRCIFDEETEEMYTRDDLGLLCALLNQLVR